MSDRPGLRRTPIQARSKARVEAILDAATALIVRDGVEALNLTAVAREADVPIGSVYQYFGDVHDLLAVMVDRYFSQMRALVSDATAKAKTIGDVRRSLLDLARRWFALHEQDASFRLLLEAVLADPVLQRANIEDSIQTSKIIAASLTAHTQDLDPAEVHRVVLIVDHLFVYVFQLAVSHEDPAEQRRVFDAWLQIAELALGSLVKAT